LFADDGESCKVLQTMYSAVIRTVCGTVNRLLFVQRTVFLASFTGFFSHYNTKYDNMFGLFVACCSNVLCFLPLGFRIIAKIIAKQLNCRHNMSPKFISYCSCMADSDRYKWEASS